MESEETVPISIKIKEGGVTVKVHSEDREVSAQSIVDSMIQSLLGIGYTKEIIFNCFKDSVYFNYIE